MVYRVYVEKKPGLDNEARALRHDIRHLLRIPGVDRVRLFNRYDAENLPEEVFEKACTTVFSEPPVDNISFTLDTDGATVFAVEYLPGQFDQRADSAAQCIGLLAQGERPAVRTAKVYLLYGTISDEELAQVKNYVINPVEAREASLDEVETLIEDYATPDTVETLHGFIELDEAGLADFVKNYALAMDNDDIAFCQQYFISEKRDPTLTEIRMIDTYWSDHCRHTTFLTTIDSVSFEDELLQKAYDEYLGMRKDLNRTKPINLMDIATIATKVLKKEGKLPKLDESEEINACTVKMDVEVDGVKEPWLLLFKNETHNHPTEIEPFGGAATCIGGAIRDPLSGRSYVYGAMRVTGAANPLKSVDETLPGKLPQRKLVRTAAAGYSSYGNQIGLATGIVHEMYHEGYAAKRLEIGAVVGAAPEKNVRREVPEKGDVIILLGGRTGRDGCGGATGSSKSHTLESLTTCGAEVQKGNAPEERKLQRLFRKEAVCRMIKRCNDFGAGGVSVAIGELADGLTIELDAVPKKYEGLDGTELAISESQERMAVVVAAEDADRMIAMADEENLEATVVAVVTEEPRLVMHWKGSTVVDISREFLNSNGAQKHIDIHAAAIEGYDKPIPSGFFEGCMAMTKDLNVCSQRGLSERFDSTIGAGTVLMPFGGKHQMTPIQAMVHKVSVERGHTDDCSMMAWGYNPYIAEKSPYHGAYLAVIESVCRLIATGADFNDVYLTFQEYFARPGKDPERWGQPLSALLGALRAQRELNIAAIGGKDSMSGTFEQLDVPPTLVSFAVTTQKADRVISPEFKAAGHKLYFVQADKDENGLPVTASLMQLFDTISAWGKEGKLAAMMTPGYGGIAESVLKMALGNGIGAKLNDALSMDELFGYAYGGFVIETAEELCGARLIGETVDAAQVSFGGETVDLSAWQKDYEDTLESVYATNAEQESKVETFSFEGKTERKAPRVGSAKPRVLIPVFPGTNCEYDTAKVLADAGAEPQILVINNRTADGIARSVDAFAKAIAQSQMIFIPGGFSGGDEPDGSAKLITAFFRNAEIREETMKLLNDRDGLMAGICNGFQALIKLGLVPYGRILDADADFPTLTYNSIGRHQSRVVSVRIASNRSPWLANTNVGDVYRVPISHGEGRFLASEEAVKQLAENGQIATQYVDDDANATMDIRFNPNGSVYAIEGITSPDGRVFGKMGHAERIGSGLYRNVQGEYDMKMFAAAVDYFKK